MEIIQSLINILSLIIGYFIGCVLPAYLFGKWRKIDIRKEGTLNPGTSNAFRVLGLAYAVPTALYDTLKGIFSMLIAYVLGADFIFVQLSGIMAIIGHLFPFYLRFRGGQGVATATGMILYYLLVYISNGLEIFFAIGFCIVIVVLFIYITKMGSILSILVFPVLDFSLFVFYPTLPYNIFFTLISIHIIFIGLYKIIKEKKIVIKDETFLSHWWRVAIRPVAILFLVFYLFISQLMILILVGIVVLVFLTIDLTRILHKRTNELLTQRIKYIFKKTEQKRFSSMTIFLIAIFFAILLFEKNIAITSVVFLIFGDIFSKIFGMAFGRHKIFDKTLEGTLAFLGSVLITGYIIYFSPLNISLIVLICGGIVAPISEIMPIDINDNFTVPILSGVAMTAALFFGF